MGLPGRLGCWLVCVGPVMDMGWPLGDMMSIPALPGCCCPGEPCIVPCPIRALLFMSGCPGMHGCCCCQIHINITVSNIKSFTKGHTQGTINSIPNKCPSPKSHNPSTPKLLPLTFWAICWLKMVPFSLCKSFGKWKTFPHEKWEIIAISLSSARESIL